MKCTITEYTFHRESGNPFGWLAVPIQEVLDTGAEVSNLSSVCTKRGMVYLYESGFDVYNFLKAKDWISLDTDEGYEYDLPLEVKFNEVRSDSPIWIHNLPRCKEVLK